MCTEDAHYAAQPWFPHLCPGPSQKAKGSASSQHRDSQARLGRSGFDCWGLEEFWGFGGFTTHVRAWPAVSSPLHHSGCRNGCSGVGPLWLVPFGVELFMINVFPWHHFPLKTWTSDPALSSAKAPGKTRSCLSPFHQWPGCWQGNLPSAPSSQSLTQVLVASEGGWRGLQCLVDWEKRATVPGWLSQHAWEGLWASSTVHRVGVRARQGMAVGGSIGAFLELPLLLFVQLTQLLSFKS